MKQMKEWEEFTYKAPNIESEKEKAKETLKKIFLEFCTLKDRKYGKPNFFSTSPISNYDINTQPIYKIVENTKKTIIYTKLTNKGFWNLRYTILSINNSWLIDKKEISFDNGETWKRENL
ncbi:NTF2 fold immunity protein [Pasteurella sp. PK-2025]|uniref:NTF2 fold immunity protein n=1 Tax=Pasteurella sp. PK-2025 TaxID=3413133 RepID=UPI003C7085F9